jgi:hypothetical protein
MINAPKTIEEARKHKYNKWAGNPSGWDYVEDRCAYDVWDKYMFGSRQCFRKAGHGPDELYCKQHAKMVR